MGWLIGIPDPDHRLLQLKPIADIISIQYLVQIELQYRDPATIPPRSCSAESSSKYSGRSDCMHFFHQLQYLHRILSISSSSLSSSGVSMCTLRYCPRLCISGSRLLWLSVEHGSGPERAPKRKTPSRASLLGCSENRHQHHLLRDTTWDMVVCVGLVGPWRVRKLSISGILIEDQDGVRTQDYVP